MFSSRHSRTSWDSRRRSAEDLLWLWHVYLMACTAAQGSPARFANLFAPQTCPFPSSVRRASTVAACTRRLLFTICGQGKVSALEEIQSDAARAKWRRNFRQPQIAVCGSLRNYSTVIGSSFSFAALCSSPIDSNFVWLSHGSANLAAPLRKSLDSKHTTFNYAIKSFLELSSEKLMERKNCCKCVEDFFTSRRRPPTTGNRSLVGLLGSLSLARPKLEARQATPQLVKSSRTALMALES